MEPNSEKVPDTPVLETEVPDTTVPHGAEVPDTTVPIEDDTKMFSRTIESKLGKQYIL